MSETIVGWKLRQYRAWQTLDGRFTLNSYTDGTWGADCHALADEHLLWAAGLTQQMYHFRLNKGIKKSAAMLHAITGCDRRVRMLTHRSGYYLLGTQLDDGPLGGLAIVIDGPKQWRLFVGWKTAEAYTAAAGCIAGQTFATRQSLLSALSEHIEPPGPGDLSREPVPR